MAGGDACLKMIFADRLTRSRFAQVRHPARDHRLVPSRAILFFEPKQISLVIFAGRKPRSIQQHQREQRMRLGLIPGLMLRQ